MMTKEVSATCFTYIFFISFSQDLDSEERTIINLISQISKQKLKEGGHVVQSLTDDGRMVSALNFYKVPLILEPAQARRKEKYEKHCHMEQDWAVEPNNRSY